MLLTMVVSLDAVLSQLQTRNKRQQCKALKTLAMLGFTGGMPAVNVAIDCFEERSSRVHKSAVHALTQLGVRTGSDDYHADRIVAQMGYRLSHQKTDVRLSAISVLSNIARKIDESVSLRLCECMSQDASTFVRSAASDALKHIVEKDNVNIVTALLGHLQHRNAWVRIHALSVLPMACCRSDERVISVVVKQLECRPRRPQDFVEDSSFVCKEALMVLNDIAEL